ncbi:bifunctional folylpolyglutamate synthase/dihydrofolate synthase [candidate division KSB1 bacterium]|nr:bifunctional folylpolyglutamate synthase/dihydrofolate synthase [candidate division KSB1 bacterium]
MGRHNQMDLTGAKQFLYELESIGWKLDLLRMTAFLDHLGNPQQRFRSAHIAGTNGKGSVAAMLEAILRATGRKTGMYTSPHLIDLRERIRTNGAMIGADDLIELVEKFHGIITEIGCTFFEAMTGLAFYHFAETGIDFAVVEVGLGGRLDATNLLQPSITAITNIGYDHMNYLGSDLPQIAREKGGIIKPGIPVVLGRMPYEAEQVLLEMAERSSSPVFSTRHSVSIENLQMQANESDFTLLTDNGRYADLRLSLAGPHQVGNACTVVLLAEKLDALGVRIDKKDIFTGLQSVEWLGRFSILKHQPLIICDVAHNADGMRMLQWMLDHFYPDRSVHLVMGVVKDKDIAAMMQRLPLKLAKVFAVPLQTQRGLPATALAAVIPRNKVEIYSSLTSGLRQAIEETGTGQLICVTGSHYIVGEALEQINNLTK